MKFAKVLSCVLSGVEVQSIEVEALAGASTKSECTIIGLADYCVKSTRERVAAGLAASYTPATEGMLVSLSPAEVRKEGAWLDLPIAAALLLIELADSWAHKKKIFFFGELALCGAIKPVRGSIAFTLHTLSQAHADLIVLPSENLKEAMLVTDEKIVGLSHIKELKCILDHDVMPHFRLPHRENAYTEKYNPLENPFQDVIGQDSAKRALTIAAAGGHNVLMSGPPGCGKSMLARRFRKLLPLMTAEEILETAGIHSIAAKPIEEVLMGIPPLCAPHHSVTETGLIGGGLTPYPGDISLAHNGILFLDELPEFKKPVLEALRTPLETSKVTVRKSRYCVTFPARFQLIAAMNPCPCGRLGMPHSRCLCGEAHIISYRQKISQPLLDRIDLHVVLEGIAPSDLLQVTIQPHTNCQSHSYVDIKKIRKMQINRSGMLNAQLPASMLPTGIRLNANAQKTMSKAAKGLNLSARTFVRVLKTARTIADLDYSVDTKQRHVAEALSFRN